MVLARGSVPPGKIEPNIMYKDHREFTPKWIQKLTTAEQELAATIMEHLSKNVIVTSGSSPVNPWPQ